MGGGDGVGERLLDWSFAPVDFGRPVASRARTRGGTSRGYIPGLRMTDGRLVKTRKKDHEHVSWNCFNGNGSGGIKSCERASR